MSALWQIALKLYIYPFAARGYLPRQYRCRKRLRLYGSNPIGPFFRSQSLTQPLATDVKVKDKRLNVDGITYTRH